MYAYILILENLTDFNGVFTVGSGMDHWWQKWLVLQNLVTSVNTVAISNLKMVISQPFEELEGWNLKIRPFYIYNLDPFWTWPQVLYIFRKPILRPFQNGITLGTINFNIIGRNIFLNFVSLNICYLFFLIVTDENIFLDRP